MAGPGDAEDRLSLQESIDATWARMNALAQADPTRPAPRLVREVVFGEQDFDKLFMPRFICRTCGPTNRVCADETGFICIVCQQAAAYQVFDQARYLPTV